MDYHTSKQAGLALTKPATPLPRTALLALSALAAVCAQWGSAAAGEGASSNMTLGATTFQTPVMDKPGFYYSNYVNYYHADRLNDGEGNKLGSSLSVNAWVNYNQFVYVTPLELGDLKIATGAVVPVARLRQTAEDTRSRSQGLADIILQPLIIGWRQENFHLIMVQGLIVPTGAYDEGSDVNVGRKTWQYQPQISLGYIDPTGIEATATVSYLSSSINTHPMQFFANPTRSNYRSGNEIAVDFALGYNFTRQFELGLTGYYYSQISRDRLSDPAADLEFQQTFHGFKGSVAALGIGARYLTEYGEFYAQVNREFEAKNRTEGTSAWLRWTIAF